jgi:hypothetical protein
MPSYHSRASTDVRSSITPVRRLIWEETGVLTLTTSLLRPPDVGAGSLWHHRVPHAVHAAEEASREGAL